MRQQRKKTSGDSITETIGVNPKLYDDVFQANPAGQKILEEMSIIFEHRLSHVPGDSHETAFREGQRSVMLFIYRKCADAQEGRE